MARLPRSVPVRVADRRSPGHGRSWRDSQLGGIGRDRVVPGPAIRGCSFASHPPPSKMKRGKMEGGGRNSTAHGERTQS